MKSEIISIGTELLMGEITDTNGSYLAAQLPPLGIDLYWVSQVGDNRARLVEVLRRAWQRSDLILTTGGLGPTEDDLTREAIAEMLGEELKTAPALEREIRGFFDQRGVVMPHSNIKQAGLIPSAEPLHNLRGTAPGWWVERDGRILVAMPGPPAEIRELWQKDILPRLRKRSTGAVLVAKTFKTLGLSEAAIGESISALISSANPTLAVYAKADGIHLRLAAKAATEKQAKEIIARGEVSLRAILDKYIWGTDNDTLEAVVGRLLTEKGLSLAVMEDYSGGWLAAGLTDIPESQAFFKGGLVTPSREAKIAFGTSTEIISRYGAISPEAAQAMAAAARVFLGADIGVGITGIEETEATPAGMVYIGIDDGENRCVISRTRGKRRVTASALFGLREVLAGGYGTVLP